MNIYLLRHGIATSAEEMPNDGDRPLTAKGSKRMRKGARGIRRLGLEFDAILTSPLARAHQTADVVAEALGQQSQLAVLDALQPGNSIDDLISSLSEYKNREHLLLVGHEPLLSEAAAFLLTGKKGIGLEFGFKKGAICHIEVDTIPPRSPGTLRSFLAPKQLRLLRGRRGAA
jgi:phosphohistidine phosphatase